MDSSLTFSLSAVGMLVVVLIVVYAIYRTIKRYSQQTQEQTNPLDPKTYARQRKAGTLCLVLVLLSGVIDTVFHLSFELGLLTGFIAIGISLIYYWIISKKSVVVIALSLVIVFTLVVFGSYLYLNNNSLGQQINNSQITNNQQLSSTQNILLSDTVWTDPQGTFQLTIPAGWSAPTSTSDFVLLTKSSGLSRGTLNIRMKQNSTGLTTNKIYEENKNTPGISLGSFAGQQAVILGLVQGNNIETINTTIIRNGIIYSLGFAVDQNQSSVSADLNNYASIASSFKFLR